MFGLATGLYKSYFSPATLSVLIIGPDCAGKTALLERLKVTQFSTARQLRNVAASHGGTVPLPRTPSGTIRGGDAEAAAEAAVANAATAFIESLGETDQHHTRHNSAPDLKLNGKPAAAPTPPKEPQTRDGPDHHRQEEEESQTPLLPPKAPATPAASGGGCGSARRQDSSASSGSRRRRFLICPAPRMYSREAMEDGDADVDEEVVVEEEEIFDEVRLSGTDHGNNSSSGGGSGRETEAEGGDDADADLDDLLGMDEDSRHRDGSADAEAARLDKAATATAVPPPTADADEHEHEHDLKPAARMLPLHLIRPTIGQNLAKIDACGCRLNVWDLGGVPKMRPLWDRYYAEVDAVVFVVDARTVGGAGGGGGISRLQETVEAFGAVRRQPALDGIPLMVFVNKVDGGEGGRLVPEDDDGDNHDKHHGDGDGAAVDGDKFVPSRVDLDVLSNAFDLSSGGGAMDDGMVVMTAGSARTGEGVRSAFEWLVLKARNVQRETQGRDRTMTT